MVLRSWLRFRGRHDGVALAHPAVQRAVTATVESLEDRRLFSTTFDLQHELHAPAPQDWASFGTGLDARGDLAVVGSSSGNNGQGEAQVYNVATGQHVLTLANPDVEAFVADAFGKSVAFTGTGNILVGAPGEDQSLVLGVGVAYLYDGATGDLLTTFNNPGPINPNGSRFGEVVASYGDDQVLIAAAGEGVVHQFDLDGNLVRTYSDPLGGSLGGAIAVNGDHLAISGSGVVHLFDGVSGALLHTFPTPSANSLNGFGAAIAFDDAGSALFIADPSNSDDDFLAGRVYRYSLLTFNQTNLYANPTPHDTSEQFGSAIAVRGDQLVVGALFDVREQEVVDPDSGDTVLVPLQQGGVYVIDIASGAVESIIDNPTAPGVFDLEIEGQDTFGARVAVANGRILVGDPLDEAPGSTTDAGGVYVFAEAGGPVNQAPVADAGPAASVNENGSITLDASGSADPDGAADLVGYAWDLDNDGQYDDATGPTVSFGQDLPGSYTVGLLVTDSAGNTSTDTVVVTVNDLQPTANAGSNQTVEQDSTVHFAGSGANVSGDAIVGYEWDFDYDGTTFDADASGANASTVYTAAGTRTVALRVTDDDGDVAITTISVTVQAPPPANTAPVVSPVSGPAIAVRNQELTFTGSFVDADAGDSHQVEWDFGDGTGIAFHSTTDAGALAPTHTYAAAGFYDVVYRIKDASGAVVSSSIHTVAVTASAMVNGTLLIGTDTAGGVTIVANGAGVRYLVNGESIQTADPTKIIIYGSDGDDVINVSHSVGVPLEIYGGDGNDLIKGGQGNDIIDGGAGDDLIYGAQGRDLLIGGLGSDIIVGNQDDDILVAGNTAYDGDSAALNALLAEWTSSRSYTERVNNLRDGSGSATRLNGSFFLTPDVTVFDDAASDLLTGGQGTDWFLFNADANNRDYAIDLTSQELADELDFINTDPTL